MLNPTIIVIILTIIGLFKITKVIKRWDRNPLNYKFFLKNMEGAKSNEAANDLLGVNPSILIGKFRSKKDLHDYMTKHGKFLPQHRPYFTVRFYLPPAETINKDFLKAVMGGEKDILPMDVVKMADVPRYEELSVKAILPKV